jgi:branched-chain amino acid transport system substrate-binding protein
LITVDRVAALLGGSDAAEATQIGKAAQPYGTPLLTAAILPADTPVDTVFSVNCDATFRGSSLALFAAKKLNVERAAVVVDTRRPVSSALADAFVETLRNAGKQSERFEYKSASELESAGLRLKKLQAGALLYAGAALELSKLLADLKGSQFEGRVLVGDGVAPWDESNFHRFEGVYVAVPYVASAKSEPTPLNESFVRRYEEHANNSPSVPAALAYDSIQIVAELLRRAQSVVPEKVRAEFAKPDVQPFQSLMGPLSFDRNHSARRPLFIGRLTAGRVADPTKYEPLAK